MTRNGILLLVAAACLVAGCRKSITVTGTDGSKGTVTKTRQGAEVTIEGKDGAKVQIGEGGLSLPDGFPSDVPIYPGASITMSVSTKEAMNVALRTSDPVSKTSAFYQDKLKANGWEIEATMKIPQGAMLTAKKQTRTVVAVVSEEQEKSAVTLTVQEEK